MTFKIQYGEIYSCMKETAFIIEHKFKIQYGEIYSSELKEVKIEKILFKIQYGEIYRYAKSKGTKAYL